MWPDKAGRDKPQKVLLKEQQKVALQSIDSERLNENQRYSFQIFVEKMKEDFPPNSQLCTNLCHIT